MIYGKYYRQASSRGSRRANGGRRSCTANCLIPVWRPETRRRPSSGWLDVHNWCRSAVKRAVFVFSTPGRSVGNVRSQSWISFGGVHRQFLGGAGAAVRNVTFAHKTNDTRTINSARPIYCCNCIMLDTYQLKYFPRYFRMLVFHKM